MHTQNLPEVTGCRVIIDHALEVRDTAQERRTETITWEGLPTTLPVVRLPVDAVRLNPHSLRLRPRMESLPERQQVLADPFSRTSQLMLADLLQRKAGSVGDIDHDYKHLRKQLQAYQQQVPACVTRDGVLINGNTRLVALRELGVGYILACVLPEGASPRAVVDLELSQDVVQWFKRQHPFTAVLLSTQHLLVERELPKEAVMAQLGIDARQLGLRLRTLHRIRCVQEWSLADDGEGLPLPYFDDKQKALTELDIAVENLRRTQAPPQLVEAFEHARLLGLLVGTGYMRQRVITADLVRDNYLGVELRDTPWADLVTKLPASGAGVGIQIPGLPFLLPVAVGQTPTVSLDRLVRRVAVAQGNAYHRKEVHDFTLDGDNEQLLTDVGHALKAAADSAASAQPDGPELGKAARQLIQAGAALRAACESLVTLDRYTNAGIAGLDAALREVAEQHKRIAALMDGLRLTSQSVEAAR